MEQDIILEEYLLMPFLEAVLTQAGFKLTKTLPDVIRNTQKTLHGKSAYAKSGVGGGVQIPWNKYMDAQLGKRVFETVQSCMHLKKIIKRIQPLLSVLIRGGKKQSRIIKKMFSTKQRNKQCYGILNVYYVTPRYFKVRAPRSKRY